MDYLKTRLVNIESIGGVLTLRQLSAKGAAEFSRTYEDEKNRWLAGAVICKYGVVDWLEKEPQDLVAELTTQQIAEISEAIRTLSDPDRKNSDGTPSASSSSS